MCACEKVWVPSNEERDATADQPRRAVPGAGDARAFGHVGGLAVYDPSTAPGGTLTADDIRTLIAGRIHMLPPFTRKLAQVPFGLDLPYWVEDPDFDLDFHVREIGLAPPATTISSPTRWRGSWPGRWTARVRCGRSI